MGKTLKVDMKFTRKHGVLRILVCCLNHTKIPRAFPMLIKGALYTLTFDVEGEEGFASEDVVMTDLGRDKDDEGDMRDDFRDALAKKNNLQNSTMMAPKESAAAAPLPEKGSGGAPLATEVVLSPLVRRCFQAAREEFFDGWSKTHANVGPCVDHATISVVAECNLQREESQGENLSRRWSWKKGYRWLLSQL